MDEAAFDGLLAALPPAAAARAAAAMEEPWRRYHARWHLGRMWRLHRAHGPRAWDADIALLVAYHDAVYEPDAAAPRNECRSAAMLLGDAGELGLRPARAASLTRAVILSADHLGEGAALTPGEDPAGAWFLDLDLEPLGMAGRTALIRAEHAHVPDAAFAAGRRAFLHALLARPRLFRTATAAALGWEGAARAAIAAELAQ